MTHFEPRTSHWELALELWASTIATPFVNTMGLGPLKLHNIASKTTTMSILWQVFLKIFQKLNLEVAPSLFGLSHSWKRTTVPWLTLTPNLQKKMVLSTINILLTSSTPSSSIYCRLDVMF